MRAPRVRPSLKQRALAGVLALAVLFAGLLGLAHRTVHVPGQAPAQVQPVAPHAAPSGIDALFGGHDDAQCRLYDQLVHGASAPSVPPLVLPVLLPAASFAVLAVEALARRIALFHARGPPPAP